MSDLIINARILYEKINSELQKKLKKEQTSQKEESLIYKTKTESSSDDDNIYGDIINFKKNKTNNTQSNETKEINNNKEISADDIFIYKYTNFIKSDKKETKTTEISKKDEMLILEAEKRKNETKSEEKSSEESTKVTEEESLNLQKQIKELTKEYYEKITNRKLKFANYTDTEYITEDLTYFNLLSNLSLIGEYRITDKDGNVVIPTKNDIPSDIKVNSDGSYYTDDGRKYVVISDISNTDYFQNALRNGDLLIEKAFYNELTGETTTTWSSISYENLDFIEDHYYTEDDASAEAEYVSKMEEIYADSSNTVVLDDFETAAQKYMDKEKEQELNDKYEEKMSNKRLKFVYNTDDSDNTTIIEDLSYFSIIANKNTIGEYRIVDENENIIVPSSEYIPLTATKIGDNYYSTDVKKYIINEDIAYSETFQELLREGTLKLQKASTENEQTTWTLTPIEELDFIQESLYTEDDTFAEAEYEYEIQKLKEEAYLRYLSE